MSASFTPDTTVNKCFKSLNKFLHDSFEVNQSDLFDFMAQIYTPIHKILKDGIMIFLLQPNLREKHSD